MLKKIDIPFQDNIKIIGDLHINKKSKKLIILCHGYQDTKDEHAIKRIAELLENHYNVYRFNFTDRKKPFLPIEKQNIQTIVNFFSKKYDEVVLLGASLGGLSVLLSADKDLKIDKFIFINPFVYYFKKVAWRFRKMLITMLVLYPFLKSVRNNLDFYFKNINPKNIVSPTLMIVAENDKTVNSIHGKILFREINSKQKKLILDKNIDHGLNKEIYLKYVTDYIIDWLK